MPNWCDNGWYLKGTKDVLDNLVASIKSGKFFEYIIPIGVWEYDKACDSWDTKWDVGSDVYINREDDNLLHLSFTSAWSPPIKVLTAMNSGQYEVIRATYYEGGMGFCGELGDTGGVLAHDHYDAVGGVPEDLATEVGMIIECADKKQLAEEGYERRINAQGRRMIHYRQQEKHDKK